MTLRIIQFAVVAGGRVNDISASCFVFIALSVDVYFQKIHKLARLFDGKDFFNGSIRIAAVDDNGAEPEHSLSERPFQALVHYTVKLHLVLDDGEKAFSGDKLFFCENISRERPRQTEERSLFVCPDLSGHWLCHIITPLNTRIICQFI